MILKEIKKYDNVRRDNGFIYFSFLNDNFVCKVINVGNRIKMMVGNMVRIVSYITYPGPVHLIDEIEGKTINNEFLELINLKTAENINKILIIKNKNVNIVKENSNTLIRPEDTVNGIHICTVGEFNNFINNYHYFKNEEFKNDINHYHFNNLTSLE